MRRVPRNRVHAGCQGRIVKLAARRVSGIHGQHEIRLDGRNQPRARGGVRQRRLHVWLKRRTQLGWAQIKRTDAQLAKRRRRGVFAHARVRLPHGNQLRKRPHLVEHLGECGRIDRLEEFVPGHKAIDARKSVIRQARPALGQHRGCITRQLECLDEGQLDFDRAEHADAEDQRGLGGCAGRAQRGLERRTRLALESSERQTRGGGRGKPAEEGPWSRILTRCCRLDLLGCR